MLNRAYFALFCTIMTYCEEIHSKIVKSVNQYARFLRGVIKFHIYIHKRFSLHTFFILSFKLGGELK